MRRLQTCGKNFAISIIGDFRWISTNYLTTGQNQRMFDPFRISNAGDGNDRFCGMICLTRRERLKSALYLRLKKRKVFKIVKGGPFGLFENPACCSISKTMKGDPLETK